MGTQVRYKSYLGGHKLMKDLNDDCNGNGWHSFYGEKNLGNRQYFTTFTQRTVEDAHTGNDKNGLKLKMLEHDAIFKNQVNELHRLYRTQRDMMEEIKTKGGHRHGDLFEPSSSSLQGSQSKNYSQWHISSYPMLSSVRSTVLDTETITSPLSCSKGKGTLSSHAPLQNGCLKDFEVSEVRPLKVRKKLIDLQLPADEDSDTEYAEQQGTNAFDLYRLTPNQGYNVRLESSVKLSNGGLVREKMDRLQEQCNSVCSTKISIGLVDLNEPVEVEESTESSSIKIIGHSAGDGAVNGIDLSVKLNSGFLGLPRDDMQKPGHGWNGFLNNSVSANNVNGSKWLPFSYKAEHAGGSINFVSGNAQQDNMSLHATPSKVLSQDCRRGVHFADHSLDTLVRERISSGLEKVHRSQACVDHTDKEPTEVSHLSNSYPFFGSSGVAHAMPRNISPRGKAADSSSPKLTLSHSQNSARGLNKTLQSSALNNDILGEKWYVNNCSHSNPGLARDAPSFNGVYHESSSGSKDSPVFGFDHMICSRSDKIASSAQVNYGIEKAYMASSHTDIKPLKDLNLNETFPRNAMKEAVLCQDQRIIEAKNKGGYYKPMFPWHQEKPAINFGAGNADKNVISISSSPPRDSQSSLFGKSETGKDLKDMFNPTYSTNCEIWPKNESYETQCVKKTLGVPVFEKLGTSENAASSLASSTLERKNAKEEKKNFSIDINVACDASLLESGDDSDVEEVFIEKPLEKSSSSRNFIDLNSYVTEDEELSIPSLPSSIAKMKFVAHFNLEEPAFPEEEDILSEKEKEQKQLPILPNCESEQLDDEVLMSAAETIADISSCLDETQEISILSLPDAAELESLLWFADVASIAEKLENISDKECCSYKVDDFEAMTLLLLDTKEEDYMPKPFVPEVRVEETVGNAPPARPRRGQARRGRQRKDFKRDILPGLTTLSPHEMTEDLQTFGGLMRATGHVWNLGSTRRNGGTRGRRRKAVEVAHDVAPVIGCSQQMNNVETSLEDRKSLTGWGKTTRRPRRQRCHASNAPTVVLV